MFTPGRFPLLAILIPVVFAGSLFAQRYPERDHTVFHRTPPVQTKRQITPGVTPRTHASPSTTAANNGGHGAGSVGSQSASYGGPAANSKPGAVTPSDGSEHPQ